MDIAALSTAMSQDRVQQQAAVQVQKLAMNGTEAQGAALVKMMEESSVVTDPMLGNLVDVRA